MRVAADLLAALGAQKRLLGEPWSAGVQPAGESEQAAPAPDPSLDGRPTQNRLEDVAPEAVCASLECD